ncbi:MAG: sigma-E factor negative regulatory protein [Burkholderiaceae bacterium]|nr:sigma-E factor negative regulatory protein [Burkholderiaceae bacterium]
MESMNTHTQPLNERISALMDGDLPASELDALLEDLAQEDSSANVWHLYHLTGDVLRSQGLAPQRSDLAFLQRLEPRLAREVVALQVTPSPAPTLPGAQPSRRLSSNGSWRWLASATFTLLVGVVSIGMWWTAGPAVSPQLAEVTVPAVAPVVSQAPAVMLRDPELDALMAAHQQMGGHSAWQMPSGFLRNATYERPAR